LLQRGEEVSKDREHDECHGILNAEKEVLIVIPVLNGASQIVPTLESIAALDSLETVHVHVQDGGSSDGTPRLCEDFFRSLEISPRLAPSFSVSSERDSGMYDAISRAIRRFRIPRENWLTWINAGDTIQPDALSVLWTVSESDQSGSIDWVTGPINAQLLEVGLYRKENPVPLAMIQAGLADGETLPFIQQEGTFFRYSLYRRVRSDKFSAHRAAGDYFLWLDLSHHSRGLAYASQPTATWHQCEDQLSARLRHVYDEEVERLRPRCIRYLRREALVGRPQPLFVISSGRVDPRYFSLEQADAGFSVREAELRQ
jgi:glycosyltransferase involved in cell wall biosynthesis